MRRKKVLFVAPANSKGGIGAVLDLYRNNLSNFDVLYTYPDQNKSARLLFFVKAIIKLCHLLLIDKSIGIVHIHTASQGSFYRKAIVLILSKLFRKKTVLHIHGGGFKTFLEHSLGGGSLILFLIKIADQVICLSDEWKLYFTKLHQLKNITVLSNPIQIPEYKFKFSDKNNIVLLFFGTVVESKGIFDLVNFLSENDYFKKKKLLLHIGGEGELTKMNDLLEQKNVKDQILIHGWVAGKNKIELLEKADIFILPSYAEGLPMSILEAMSYGKPIIATEVGGVPTLVQNNFNGWVYNPNEINSLTSIIDDIFKRPELLIKYSSNSYLLSKNYAIQKVVTQLEELYDQINFT